MMLVAAGCSAQPIQDTVPGKKEPMPLFLPREEPPAGAKDVHPKYLVTLVLMKEKVLYYEGVLKAKNQAREVNYSDMRKIIANAKKSIGDSIYLHIKPVEDAGYTNVVNTLDEMSIGKISRYAMLDLSRDEQRLLGLKGFMSIDQDK
jgi:hypothetical protein